MERLTFLNGDDIWCVNNDDCYEEQSEHYCGPAIERLAAYEDTGLEPAEVKDMAENAETRLLTWFEATYGFPVGQLMDLVEAKQAGRLEVLPCKVGGTAFYADEDLGRVLMGYIAGYEWLVDGALYFEFTNVESDVEWVSVECPIADFGKTVFLAREEAEKAQKGGNGDA